MSRLTIKKVIDEYSVPVTETGCWLWLGSVRKNARSPLHSYGIYGQKLAHRLVWTLFNGPIQDGMCVCHRCDVPMCVNPKHLFLGTHEENMNDMIAKGRKRMEAPMRKRDGLPAGSKLTASIVADIKKLLAKKVPQTQIAKIYGVHQTTIGFIKRGVTWKNT